MRRLTDMTCGRCVLNKVLFERIDCWEAFVGNVTAGNKSFLASAKLGQSVNKCCEVRSLPQRQRSTGSFGSESDGVPV